MLKIIFKLLLFISLCFFYAIWNANNLIVSPVRYEIEIDPWESLTRTAFITNNSDEPILISAWKQDFVPSQDAWVPDFWLTGNDHLNFSLEDWISYDEEAFILWPFEKREITFYIDVPENASPWWHYGSVFFWKDDGQDTIEWNIVYVRVQYGILLLINVRWEVIEQLHLKWVSVQDGSWSTLEVSDDDLWDDINTEEILDNAGLKIICSLGNLIPEKYKWGYEEKYKEQCFELTSAEDKEEQDIGDEDFDIEFKIPFVNEWNTHVKPIWKIKLIDEDGNVLKRVWKEVLIDEDGTITWEKIVDYLPINNFGWNVLPSTSREFLSNWEWFSYKWYDEEGNEVIKYLTPGQYYTLKNQKERPFVMFWERVLERVSNKKIKAVFDIEYKKLSGEVITFNAAKEFNISYKEKYIGLNMFVVKVAAGIVGLIFLLYVIRLIRTEVCHFCRRRNHKKLKACKYCNKRKKIDRDPDLKPKKTTTTRATKTATKAPKSTKATKTTRTAKTTKTTKK